MDSGHDRAKFLLVQGTQAINERHHRFAAVFVSFVGCINIAFVVVRGQHIKYDIVLVDTADIANQCITDQGGCSALLHIRIQTGKPIHFKQHPGGEMGFLEDGIGLFANVIVPVHQNERGAGKAGQWNRLTMR